MFIPALFGCIHIPINMVRRFFNWFAVHVHDFHFFPGQSDDFLIFQAVNVPRFRKNGRYVRSNEVFALTQSNNQGAIFAHRIHFIGRVGTNNAQCVRTFQFLQYFYKRCKNVAFIVIFQQLCNDFCICFRNKRHTLPHQVFLQSQVVFNNSIVYHGKFSVIAHLRMGIDVARSAMRCPTGMPNADRTV